MNSSIITTLPALREAVAYYLTQPAFAFDTETIGQVDNEDRGNPRLNRVLWLSLAAQGRADVIPFGHPHGDFERWDYPLTPTGAKRQAEGKPLLASSYSKDKRKATMVFGPPPAQLSFDDEVREILRPLFFGPALKIGHNLPFDLESLSKHFGGAVIHGPYADTMAASFVVDNRRIGKLKLNDCSLREVEYDMTKGVGKNVLLHSFSEVAKYAFVDARYTWLTWTALWPQLQPHLSIWDLEMVDVLPVVVHMQSTGAPINQTLLKELDVRLRADLEESEAEIYRAAGCRFNINSNDDKVRILYGPKEEGGQGLRCRKETESGNPSVDQQALEPYNGKNAVVTALLGYSDLKKLHGTYVLAYLGGSTERTTSGKTKTIEVKSLLVNGRIHARFNQCGTEEGGGARTGRFSSSQPNLQNIPVRSPRGKQIRELFVAGEGHKLVVADFAQVEPRIMADDSNDPRLVTAFLEGEDIYTVLAEPFGINRDGGKVLVLSIAYGTGPDKLATTVGISLTEAKKIIYEDFPKRFRVLDKHKQEFIRSCKRRSPAYADTMMGRRRYLPEMFSREIGIKRRAERQAFNHRIQGTAADLNKIALGRTHRALAPLNMPKGCGIILTVHDEIVARVPEHQAEEACAIVRESMEGVPLLKKVPLIAEAKICDNWAEGK